MKKAAIYVRVSTPDQHVESQLYDLRELAARRGFEVVHEYEDRGVCGKKARRPFPANFWTAAIRLPYSIFPKRRSIGEGTGLDREPLWSIGSWPM